MTWSAREARANALYDAARRGWRCWYCGKDLDKTTCTADHLTPKSRGGKPDAENVRAACANCNIRKGNRTEAEFKRECFGRESFLQACHRTLEDPTIPYGWWYGGLDYAWQEKTGADCSTPVSARGREGYSLSFGLTRLSGSPARRGQDQRSRLRERGPGSR
jgi:hypothetical protein